MSLRNGDKKEETNGTTTANAQNAEDNKDKEAGDQALQGLETEAVNVESDEALGTLLYYFANQKCSASSTDPFVMNVLSACITLLQKDYTCALIDNTNSRLSVYYPMKIPIPESERGLNRAIYENSFDVDSLQDLIYKARRARCRERFPVPVIFYKGKPICRSSTLSLSLEVFARKCMDYVYQTDAPKSDVSQPGTPERKLSQATAPEAEANQTDKSKSKDRMTELEELYSKDPNSTVSEEPAITQSVVNELQNADVLLLQRLNIGSIVDLMVEYKKHKVGIAFSSSEKSVIKDDDKPNYGGNFKILSMPYPGCEFFEEFHQHDYYAEGLQFNWSQSMCDAPLSIPEEPSLDGLGIDWSNYKSWDLVKITQNYIKYIMKYLQETDKGILIHCISGWDRTPLFISLIRLSLWADGLAHESLNEREMLYFTIAYDWMLFGHQLKTRLGYKEEILFFCFYFLKFIVSDDYSIAPPRVGPKKSDKDTRPPSCEQSPSSKKTAIPVVQVEDISGNKKTSTSKESLKDPDSDDPFGGCHDPLFYLNSPEKPKKSQRLRTSPVRFAGFGGSPNKGRSPSPREEEFEPSKSLDRTPPIEIPNAAASVSESECGSAGSWLYVSNTGSLKSPDSRSDLEALIHDFLRTPSPYSNQSRKAKLTAVRSLFYKHYYKSVANVNYKTNQGLLSSILNSLKEMASGFTEKAEEESQSSAQ